jgi:hypothetical protein
VLKVWEQGKEGLGGKSVNKEEGITVSQKSKDNNNSKRMRDGVMGH